MNITTRSLRSYVVSAFNKRHLLTGPKFKYVPYPVSSMSKIICRTAYARPKEIDIIRENFKTKEKTEIKDVKGHVEEEDEKVHIGAYAICLLGIPIFTFALGLWQIQRRKWKLALIEDLNQRTTAEPVDLPYNLEELNSMDYRPIKVRGNFLYDQEFVIFPKSLIVDGAGASEGKGGLISGSGAGKGCNVITPFKLADRDLTILVNRGWLPQKYKDIEQRKKTHKEGVTEIIGTVRLTETRPQFMPENRPDKGLWSYRNLYEMAEYAGTAPVFIDMIRNKRVAGMPIGSQTRISLRNEHLSYIVTWFGLSGFTGWFWIRQFILKKPLF